MAKKRNDRGEQGSEARPRIKSSHEKVAASKRARKAQPRTVDRAPSKARPHPAPPIDDGAGWSVASESARERATAIAVAALEKKAMGVEILDVAGKVDYADFLVVMTGRSDRHAQALSQGIEEALRKKGVRPIAVEGLPHATWVLMDFGDVVVHVFQAESRQLYDIEGLWLDAARLPVPADLAPESPSS
jgi:ribosome-associated protein